MMKDTTSIKRRFRILSEMFFIIILAGGMTPPGYSVFLQHHIKEASVSRIAHSARGSRCAALRRFLIISSNKVFCSPNISFTASYPSRRPVPVQLFINELAKPGYEERVAEYSWISRATAAMSMPAGWPASCMVGMSSEGHGHLEVHRTVPWEVVHRAFGNGGRIGARLYHLSLMFLIS
ncbi:MAG: hypothetical protein LBT14_03075 [Treponema sp.]|jgi:hypothetical protein|nr:hypothetical protein [Treponema sp.]